MPFVAGLLHPLWSTLLHARLFDAEERSSAGDTMASKDVGFGYCTGRGLTDAQRFPFLFDRFIPKILQSSDILTHLPFVASWIACWKLFKFESLNFDLCVWQCNLTWLFIEYLLSKSPPRGQVSFNAVLRSNLAAGDMKEAQPCFFIQCYCEDFS